MERETMENVHYQVIKDCISKVRDEFISNGGPGENLLKELQETWEKKIAKVEAIQNKAALQNPALEGAISPVHNLDVIFPPTSMQKLISEINRTPLPGSYQRPLNGTTANKVLNIHSGTPISPCYHHTVNNGVSEKQTKVHYPFMQSSPLVKQSSPLDFDLNVEYVKDKEETESYSATRTVTQDFPTVSSGQFKRKDFSSNYDDGANIPQEDGVGDDPKESQDKDYPLSNPYHGTFLPLNIHRHEEITIVEEDYSLFPTPVPFDYDDEALNENDDEDVDDDNDDSSETNPDGENIIVAQFDKVRRVKSKWKCTLKNGIAHLNNKDIIFYQAIGEFDF